MSCFFFYLLKFYCVNIREEWIKCKSSDNEDLKTNGEELEPDSPSGAESFIPFTNPNPDTETRIRKVENRDLITNDEILYLRELYMQREETFICSAMAVTRREAKFYFKYNTGVLVVVISVAMIFGIGYILKFLNII